MLDVLHTMKSEKDHGPHTRRNWLSAVSFRFELIFNIVRGGRTRNEEREVPFRIFRWKNDISAQRISPC